VSLIKYFENLTHKLAAASAEYGFSFSIEGNIFCCKGYYRDSKSPVSLNIIDLFVIEMKAQLNVFLILGLLAGSFTAIGFLVAPSYAQTPPPSTNATNATAGTTGNASDATAGLPPGSTAIPAMLPEPIPFEFTDPNNPDAAGFVLKTADTGLARTVAKAIALYNLDQGGALSGTVTATETGGFGTIGDSFDRFIDTVGNEADKAINRAVKAWQVIRGNSETAGIGDEAAGFGISLGAFGFNVGFQCC
jgi:hypothetical protein